MPRKQEGSVIHDPQQVAQRVLQMVSEGKVRSLDGQTVPITAQTVCVHGDTPGAVAMIQAIRKALDAAGVEVKAFGAF